MFIKGLEPKQSTWVGDFDLATKRRVVEELDKFTSQGISISDERLEESTAAYWSHNSFALHKETKSMWESCLHKFPENPWIQQPTYSIDLSEVS